MAQTMLIVGAGNMGGALLSGWLSASQLVPRNITILDPSPGVDAVYAIERGARHVTDLDDLKGAYDAVMLSVKPQIFARMGSDLSRHVGTGTLILSIMAGIASSTLEAAFPSATIVRAMPNTPASIGKGVTAYYAAASLSDESRDGIEALLSASGTVVRVGSDQQIDAVTAVSGSGPAYIFHLCEALTAAAMEIGLDSEAAAKLARQTIIGASGLLDTSDRSPEALRKAVTSPGGTTQAALSVLMDADGLEALMTKAVRAAFDRAQELSG